jgi:hypothetical protein
MIDGGKFLVLDITIMNLQRLLILGSSNGVTIPIITNTMQVMWNYLLREQDFSSFPKKIENQSN